VARFKREARAAAKLHHTNIVPVYAQGEHEGHFYYAMELVEGKGLDWVMRHSPSWIAPKKKPPGPAEGDRSATDEMTDSMAVRLGAGYQRLALMIAGVAEGLAHAHQQGVIHRDVKPQNLLLGTDEQLHITDFGLARLLDEPGVTVSGEMLGTPAYMSPEQVGAHQSKIDQRTDVYSLGVTFYELLTRRRPFEGITRDQIIARICTDEPRPPRKLDPHIPVDLETICLRAMEKDPRRRYQNASDMAADLRRYAEDRPILSRRVGPIEKALKWVRRHRALTAVIALSLTLTTGAAIWTGQLLKTRHRQANQLVQSAFDLLAYADYRDTGPARALLDRARDLGPEQLNYRKTLALAHLMENPRLSIGHLEWAVMQKPDDPELLFLLAWALRREDERNPRSRDWVERANAAGGATTAAGHFFHGQAVVRNEPEEAIEAYRNATLKRENYSQALLHLGRALNHWMYHHRKHENFSEQRRSLESACALQPKKAYPRYLLSIAYRLSAEIYHRAENAEDAARHFDLALRWAKEAQKEESGSPLGYVCEAEYWEILRDYAAALAARQQAALRCQTKFDLADLCLKYRWRLYYWTGQRAEALADLETLAAYYESTVVDRVWYTGLFPSLIRADMGEMDEALGLARSMAESMPTSFRAVTSSAAMLRILGRPEEAQALLTARADGIEPSASFQALTPANWQQELIAFSLGRRTLAELQQVAGPSRDEKLLWSAPHFLEGAAALGQRRREAALEAFRDCEQTYDYIDYDYLARVFVRKLEEDPAWPHWLRTTTTLPVQPPPPAGSP
jgi:tetratricopeptide (TPR) repeat protein